MAHKLPMELHHDNHHKAYVDNLNQALDPYPRLAELTAEDLLRRLDQVPEAIRTAIRNNGGGHVNHQFFWDILGPRTDGAPKGAIADAVKRDFGSFEQFQSLFTDAATKHFGSGWAFLGVYLDAWWKVGAWDVVDERLRDVVAERSPF